MHSLDAIKMQQYDRHNMSQMGISPNRIGRSKELEKIGEDSGEDSVKNLSIE